MRREVHSSQSPGSQVFRTTRDIKKHALRCGRAPGNAQRRSVDDPPTTKARAIAGRGHGAKCVPGAAKDPRGAPVRCYIFGSDVAVSWRGRADALFLACRGLVCCVEAGGRGGAAEGRPGSANLRYTHSENFNHNLQKWEGERYHPDAHARDSGSMRPADRALASFFLLGFSHSAVSLNITSTPTTIGRCLPRALTNSLRFRHLARRAQR